MTQDERNLLMKDLSCRQPYGVKVQIDQQGLQEHDNYWNGWNLDKEAQEVSGVLKYGVTLDFMAMVDGVIPFEFVRPYLFPMSSMTEEQEKEESQIKQSYDYDEESFMLFDWYNKNHFDYRGLISKGLAIDATGLNIY